MFDKTYNLCISNIFSYRRIHNLTINLLYHTFHMIHYLFKLKITTKQELYMSNLIKLKTNIFISTNL